jgi:hypothetical protein
MLATGTPVTEKAEGVVPLQTVWFVTTGACGGATIFIVVTLSMGALSPFTKSAGGPGILGSS